MINRPIWKFISIGILSLIILIAGGGLGLYYLNKATLERDRRILEPISKQLEIEPTWEALDDYMRNTFKEGMSRAEVLKLLEKFDDYKITPRYSISKRGYCERVLLPTGTKESLSTKESDISILDPKYTFCYSSGDTLERMFMYPG